MRTGLAGAGITGGRRQTVWWEFVARLYTDSIGLEGKSVRRSEHDWSSQSAAGRAGPVQTVTGTAHTCTGHWADTLVQAAVLRLVQYLFSKRLNTVDVNSHLVNSHVHGKRLS